jgi:hypothetical protein
MLECKECKFCDTQYATKGYGYCNIKLPAWMVTNSNSAFGSDKLVSVKESDGCDLAQPCDEDDFQPTQSSFL